MAAPLENMNPLFEALNPRDRELLYSFKNQLLACRWEDYFLGPNTKPPTIQHVLNRSKIPETELVGKLKSAIWIIYFTMLKNITPMTVLKYPTFDKFMIAYADEFLEVTEQAELISLWHTANWMYEMLSHLDTKRCKGFLIDVATKVVEGLKANYKTGGAPSARTKLRITVFERESNTKPPPRKSTRMFYLMPYMNPAINVPPASSAMTVEEDDGDATDSEDNGDDENEDNDDNRIDDKYLIDYLGVNPRNHKYFKALSNGNFRVLQKFISALNSSLWCEENFPSVDYFMVKAKFIPTKSNPKNFHHILWILYYRELQKVTSLNSLLYPTIEEFQNSTKDILSPDLLHKDYVEYERLWHTANWMHELSKHERVCKSGIKGLLMEIVPRIVGGFDAKYVTGSGANDQTKRTVQIYELVTGNKAKKLDGKLPQSKDIVVSDSPAVNAIENIPSNQMSVTNTCTCIPSMNSKYLNMSHVDVTSNNYEFTNAPPLVLTPSHSYNTFVPVKQNQDMNDSWVQSVTYDRSLMQTVYPVSCHPIMLSPKTNNELHVPIHTVFSTQNNYTMIPPPITYNRQFTQSLFPIQYIMMPPTSFNTTEHHTYNSASNPQNTTIRSNDQQCFLPSLQLNTYTNNITSSMQTPVYMNNQEIPSPLPQKIESTVIPPIYDVLTNNEDIILFFKEMWSEVALDETNDEISMINFNQVFDNDSQLFDLESMKLLTTDISYTLSDDNTTIEDLENFSNEQYHDYEDILLFPELMPCKRQRNN